MLDEKIDEKEADELKKVYSHSLDKRSEKGKYTLFKVQHVFGDIIAESHNNQDHII